MSDLVNPTQYQQPKSSPSFTPAVLTLVVHAILIGLLYFGLTLQTNPPVEIELWDGASLEAANQTTATPIVKESTTIETAAVKKQPDTVQAEPIEADINTPLAAKPVTQSKQEETKPTERTTPTTAVTPTKTRPSTETKPSTQTTPTVDSPARAAILSQQKAGAGSNSGVGDASAYSARVKQRVEQQAKVRNPGQAFSAAVSIRLDPSGNVTSKNWLKKSGNAEWDNDLMAAISRASPMPKPVHPEALKGITLNFKH